MSETLLNQNDPPADIPAAELPTHLQNSTIFDLLPKDSALQGNEALKDFKGIEGLAKSFIDTQKMVGADKSALVQIPKEDAAKEDVDAFYTRLGRPVEPKGYEFSKVELPEGLGVNEEVVDAFRANAHELGLNSKQADGIFKWYMGLVGQQYGDMETKYEESRNEAEAALKKEYGKAYNQNLELSKSVVNSIDDEGEFKKWLDDTGLGNDPQMIRFMVAMGQKLGEDNIDPGKQTEFMMSPEAAQAKITELKSDSEFVKKWTDQYHVGHKEAVAQMDKLYKMAYPEETQGV